SGTGSDVDNVLNTVGTVEAECTNVLISVIALGSRLSSSAILLAPTASTWLNIACLAVSEPGVGALVMIPFWFTVWVTDPVIPARNGSATAVHCVAVARVKVNL